MYLYIFKLMKEKLYIIILFYYIQSSFSCSSNFECDSMCCKNNQCFTKNECEWDRDKIYIGVGIVAGVFFITSIIYLLIMLKGISVSMKKKEEDLKEKIENAEIFQKSCTLKKE